MNTCQFAIGIMLNFHSLDVYLKMSKIVENSKSTQVIQETDSYKPYGFFLNPVINHCYVLFVYMLIFIYMNKYV